MFAVLRQTTRLGSPPPATPVGVPEAGQMGGAKEVKGRHVKNSPQPTLMVLERPAHEDFGLKYKTDPFVPRRDHKLQLFCLKEQ